MTNKDIMEGKWVYIPDSTENFSNKKKGKYIRKVNETTIEERINGVVKSFTYLPEKCDYIWKQYVEGISDDTGNEEQN